MLAVTLVFVTAVASFPPSHLGGLAGMAFYPAFMVALGGIPLGPLLRRSARALPFALAAALGSAFFGRTPVFALGPFTVTAGMVACVSLVLKALLSVSAVLILSAAASFEGLCAFLAGAGMPRAARLQLALTHRYMAVLTEESAAMTTAYALRSRSGGIKLRHGGSFLGQLLLRSFDRAGRVYGAMLLRGFDGTFRAGGEGKKWTAGDTAFTLGVSLAVAAFRVFEPASLLGKFLAGGPG
ncbi:MAG: energy-coupling factor transporter transmembrane protein EcfT [Spirochaetaceae bacterium]|jgi:cobalt/nickel transport system permease protein|nr:energy-coupling factor transporter transmembrane protein EcfT [Spirochaetaceae bacterium]